MSATTTTYNIPVYKVALVREGSELAAKCRVRTGACVAGLLHNILDMADREHFGILMLDTQNVVRGIHIVTVGTLDAALVHPRETFKAAILASAASIILFHNHPSGDPTPSAEDKAVTRTMQRAGEVLGISVLDHVVVGERGRSFSFMDHGMM